MIDAIFYTVVVLGMVCSIVGMIVSVRSLYHFVKDKQ
jgi:hypothetical protein